MASQDEYLTELNPAACVVCPAGQRLMKGGTSSSNCGPCDTNHGKFVDGSGYCDGCLNDCSECNDKTRCTKCQDPNKSLQLDGSCAPGCPINHLADSNKVCQPISCTIKGCRECSSNEVCSRCSASYYLLSNNTCSQDCPNNHKVDSNNRCQPISCTIQNCVTCSSDEICSVCQGSFELSSNECKTTKEEKIVEFVLIQEYPSLENFEFTFGIEINTKGLSEAQIRLINQAILKIEVKNLEIGFSDKKEKNEEEGGIWVAVDAQNTSLQSYQESLYLLLSTKRQKSQNQSKLKYLFFNHQRIDLASDNNHNYILAAKSERYEIQDSRETTQNHQLPENYQNLASNTDSVNKNAAVGTFSATIFFSFLDIDPSGSALKFNQFLSLIKILKLIGSWFGIKLTSFIDKLSTDYKQAQSTSQRAIRVLETKRKNRFWKNKFDTYSVNIGYSGVVLYKNCGLFGLLGPQNGLYWLVFVYEGF